MKAHLGFRIIVLMSVAAASAVFGATAERHRRKRSCLITPKRCAIIAFSGLATTIIVLRPTIQLLIGYQRTQVLNWEDKSKNYLTRVHRAWKVWDAPGEMVPLSYDNKHIWVTRPDGKKRVKMHRMSSAMSS